MSAYQHVVDRLSRQMVGPFVGAGTEDLARLRALNFPPSGLEFYEHHAPALEAETVGGVDGHDGIEFSAASVRIWGVDQVEMENTQSVPGTGIWKHGYVVFASTMSGDAFCFNLNRSTADGETEIVLIAHDAVAEDGPADEAHRVAKPVAKTLLEFLERVETGELDQEAIY